MSKHSLIAILAFAFAAAGAAGAAEPVDWTGWYASAYGGYISGEVSSNDPAHEQSTGDYDDDGYTAGLTGGYRSQNENGWVYGVELDVLLYMEKGTAVDKVGFPDLVAYEANYRWAVLAGARAGRALGKALPYLYGLVGFANV
ncbi:autotransporter domain-containing protein, partial [bacterium]|nr:autotransporter domain-containing protein [bacterium]